MEGGTSAVGRSREERIAGWFLRLCAPRDAEVAMSDLREERRGQGGGRLRFWTQLVLVCAWGLRGRLSPGRLRPFHALRMAARGLARTPGTAATAAPTLGVGLTATVALLGTFLGSFRPLPVPDGEDIVQIRVLDARAEAVPVGAELLERWRSAAGPILGIGATRSASVTVVREGLSARRAYAAAVTPGALDLLRVPPVSGRLPDAERGDRDAALVREDLWRELAPDGADPLGATLRIDGRLVTVVGLMPASFGFPEAQNLWTVLPEDEIASADQVVARLRPGVGHDAAAQALAGALGPELVGAGAPAPQRVRVLDYVDERGEGGETVAFAALGVLVGLLLVICTANASTLLLIRAAERVRTLAVHSALGASRFQVVLQLFLESALVAGFGGVIGLLGGSLVLAWSQSTLAPHWGYYWMRMELRPAVIVGTAIVVVACTLVAGTVPAIRAIQTDLREVLVGGSRRSGSAGRRRTGGWFVGLQVTLSTAGLVVALILMNGFARADDLLGVLPVERIAVASLTLDPADSVANRLLLASLREEVAAIPGARSASLSAGVPGFGGSISSLELAGRPLDGEARAPRAWWLAADPAMLETWGIALLAGRGIEEHDATDSDPVALVTRSFASRWWEGTDPLGQHLRLDAVHEQGEWVRVVGVVEDWHPEGETNPGGRIILPLTQVVPGSIFMSARTDGDPGTLVPGLREALRRVDSDLAPDRVETMEGLVAWLIRMPRTMGAFGAAGGLAGVVVASIGLFGILSFRVRTRLPAVGIRMALGARRDRILGEVLAEAARSVVPWIAAGLALGLLLAPATVIFSFGAPFRAPTTYLAAGALMLLVVLAASLLPAIRAARLDPLTVLRGE